MYNYQGFGLHILSEIEFPELLPAIADIADITVKIGDVPVNINGKRLQGNDISYIINEEELLFSVKDIATYYAAYGREIIIAPETGNLEMRSIRLFVLATAIAAILLQRGLLPLHASAILDEDELVLICGRSGAGKSTTLAGLCKQGYTIFSDDITVLQQCTDTNVITGTASYPMIKLWEDSLLTLDQPFFQDRSFPVRPGMDKYGIFFHDDFNSNEYPVKKILLLDIGEDNEVRSKKLTGTQAFEAISNQIYRPVLLHSQSLRTLSFQVISKLLQRADIYYISRPMHCKPEKLLSVISSLV
ncbi:HPr kinase [Chitinophaga oryziterrae]